MLNFSVCRKKYRIISALLLFTLMVPLSGYAFAQTKATVLDYDGRQYIFLSEETLRKETGYSTWTRNYKESLLNGKPIAIFLSFSGQCWFFENKYTRRSRKNGLSANTHFIMSSLSPSVTELGWNAYVSDKITDTQSILDAEKECAAQTTVGASMSSFPVYLVLGSLHQHKKRNGSYYAPYLIIKEIVYTRQGAESFLVPGETAKAGARIAARLLSRRASRR